jgi:hypothetical protein
VGNDFGAEDGNFALEDVGRMTVHGREKVGIKYPGDAQIFCIRKVSNSIRVPRNVLSIRFGQILKVWICLLKENSNIAGVENVLAQNDERAVKVHFGKTNRRLTPRREETRKQEATGDGETTKSTSPVPWHTFHTLQFVAKHAERHKPATARAVTIFPDAFQGCSAKLRAQTDQGYWGVGVLVLKSWSVGVPSCQESPSFGAFVV